MATKHYLYYVEGEDDKKVVDTLKKRYEINHTWNSSCIQCC